MKNEQPSKLNCSSTETERKKLPYNSPKFHVYGTVSELTSGSGGSDVDSNMPHTMSDRLTKENISQIGTHWLGIGLYLFNYKPEYREKFGKGRQFGVMADEVETVMPLAVIKHSDGYKMVNYSMLGINRVV